MRDAYAYSQAGCQKIMTVNGQARITVQPDTVVIRLAVETENMSLAQAQQENAIQMKQVIQALLQLGIREENLQTTAFTMEPVYDFEDGKQIFRGFKVQNELTVTVDDVSIIGKIIDTAVNYGVNHVSDIRFSVDNQAYFYKQALIMALEDAVSKAIAMAENMQLHLDPYPVKIDETTDEPQVHGQTLAFAQKQTTPIEPGRIMIPASVALQYQYK